MFNFYLNGTLVSDPINWADFEETVERNELLKGLLPRYDVKLDFTGDGYAFLNDLYVSGGFCQLVELKVNFKCSTGAWEEVLNGYIFLSDVKFNLNRCIAHCDVTDNNFGARIYNNKSIKTFLNTGKSKNGEIITSATEYDVSMFRPSTFTYYPTTRKGIFLYDAFKFLIEFMTDGLVGFESDYLDYTQVVTGTTLVRYMTVMPGKEIRTPSQSETAFISFEQLFREVDRKYPIAFTVISGNYGRPTIKIENADYFYGNSSGLTLRNIDNLERSIDTELLYSSVIFGGTTASFDAALHSFGNIRFLSFVEEQYFLQGECNIDKTLDLKGEFIVDTNIIEELVDTNTTNDSYDDDTFFIEVIHLGAANFALARGNPTTLTLPMYYNGNLTNNKVAERHSLAGNIALYLGDNNVSFRASKNANTATFAFQADCGSLITPAVQNTSTGFITFPDETTSPNFDASGNWLTDRYTSPQDGNYQFEMSLKMLTQLAGGVDPGGCTSLPSTMNRKFRFRVTMSKYDSGGTLVETQGTYWPNSTGYYTGAGTYTASTEALFFLPTGYTVRGQVTVTSEPYNHLLDSGMNTTILQDIDNTYIKTLATTTGGGIYKVSDINDYYVARFDFDMPLSHADYNTLKLDLSASVLFNHDGSTNRLGWIRRMRRKLATGEMEWQLISNMNDSR